MQRKHNPKEEITCVRVIVVQPNALTKRVIPLLIRYAIDQKRTGKKRKSTAAVLTSSWEPSPEVRVCVTRQPLRSECACVRVRESQTENQLPFMGVLGDQ